VTFTTDRNEFIRQMRVEFENQGNLDGISDPPSPAQIRRLFRYLNGRREDIEIAFRSYVSSFYISRPGIYVGYPGGSGDTCESWSEVLWGQRIENRNVIDCDGYAVIAVELLKEAGYHFVEYIYVFTIENWELEQSHIVAVMRLNSSTIFISNNAIFNSLSSALDAIGWNDPRKYMFSRGQTVFDAMNEANSLKRTVRDYRWFVENPRRLARRIRRYF
jgi:hypothetical protein